MRNAVSPLRHSIRLLLKDDQIVPATVIARALIETIAIGCSFLCDMDRLIAGGRQGAKGDIEGDHGLVQFL
jgi:hypothetical protein